MKIINLSDHFGDGWEWVKPNLSNHNYHWKFFNNKPKNILEKYIKNPDLARMRAAYQAAKLARNYDLVVIHGPYMAFYYSLFSMLFRSKAKTIIYSFNFAQLPRGISRFRMRYAFKFIDKFVVYSSMERKLYEDWFGININKIDMVLWSVNPPYIDKNTQPIIKGPYITAIGGNARDYPTLMAAMKMLPEIKLVAVMRAHNLKDLQYTENVTIKTDIELKDADNILAHSNFMVLPLLGTEIPCGHVTIVAAMYMGKPLIVSNSTGVEDYVENGVNAVTVDVNNPVVLADSIRELWMNSDKQQKLAKNGLDFVNENCTEDIIVRHFENYLSLNFSK